MEPTISGHEAVHHDDLLVHNWRVSRLRHRCGWLIQRELRHLPLPSKEWCPAHGDWKDSGAMGGMHAAPWQLVGSKL
jgi:hypothetical protein